MIAPRFISAAVPVVSALLAVGCASPPRPVYLPIEPREYHQAFDAADEIARAHGLIPALRDRRAGVIETDPVLAGSLLQPWDRATKSFEQALESSLSFQRKRARFEFQPAGPLSAARDPLSADDDEQSGESREAKAGSPVPGADLLALSQPPLDITQINGPLELRVWVYNERAHVPGIRRSTWSRRLTTRAQVIDPETNQPLPPSWTVVSRDRALERHLLTKIARSLDR